MATKIDLLPRYVPMRRRLKKWTFAMVGVWLAAILFIAAVHVRQSAKLDVLTQNAADATARANQTRDIQAKTTALTSDSSSADAVTFFVNAGKTGGQRATLIDQVRRYVLKPLKVDSITLSQGTDFTMQAGVRSRGEYSEAIKKMRYAELDGVFRPGSVLFSGLSTYDNGSPEATAQTVGVGGSEVTFPERINVIAQLVNPVTEPTPPGGAANGAVAGGAPGAPGAPTSSVVSGSSGAPTVSGAAPGGNPTNGPRP